MKKLLVFALAAISMVACMKEETTLLPQGDAISFDSAFIDNATRAAADPSTTTASLDGFNVWGFVKEYDGTIFNGTEVKKVDGAWSYQGTQYWVPNQPFYFAALAPMNSANWDVTLATGAAAKLGLGTVAFTNVNGTEDLLYAKEMMQSKGLNEDNGPVKFQFQHLLSKVKFTFTNGFPTETASIKVTNVKMVVPAAATIDLAQGDYSKAWTLGNGTTTLEFGDVEKLAYTQRAEVANERLTIPATAAQEYNITFTVELFMGAQSVYVVDMSSKVSGYELAMGNAYNFTAVINSESLQLEDIVFDVEVVKDWVSAGEQDVYVGQTAAVATADELKAAIADPKVSAVVLTEDINLGSTTITRTEDEAVVVDKKQYFTIDGNGKTLTYNGSDRVIDFVKGDVVKNATVKNLTINITSSYCERGINFNNTNGTLVVENVTFAGTAPTYAINLPSYSNGADVTIKNSYLAGNIALNVWGKNMTINAYNTEFVSVDNTTVENYAAVMLCNDGTTIANGTVVNINGGKIIALDENDEPSIATYNATDTGIIKVSETTEVTGIDWVQVAIIDYGASQFYGVGSLQDAIDKVAQDKKGRVRLTRDIELTEGVNVPKGATVEIDLNGKTITGIDNTETNFEIIKNQGKLLVKNGTLTLKATVNNGWNRYSAVIANTVGGNLTVEDVHIEHLGGTDMAYGIDNLTNGKGTYAVTTIENATVKSPYRAVRQFLNGVEATNELYVKAGAKLIGANKSIFFHDPSKNANSGKLVVEAGAELNGDVYLFVTAGSTEWPVEVSIAASALVGESQVLTGNVPAGYIVTKENGAYVVAEVTVANDQASLKDAIANGATIALAEGTYVLPTEAQGKTLKFVGTGDPANTVIATNTSGSYEGCNYALDGSTVEFENISITTDNQTYTGYARCKATFKNCIINNCLTLYDNCTFEGCTFNVSGDQYNIWTWGAPVATFTNCVFNSDGKAMLLYGQANTHLTINNCTFNDSGVLPDMKAAIEIGNDYNTSYNLVVNNTVVNGYEINDKGINTGTTLWANKNSMGKDKLNVVVDGVDVY